MPGRDVGHHLAELVAEAGLTHEVRQIRQQIQEILVHLLGESGAFVDPAGDREFDEIRGRIALLDQVPAQAPAVVVADLDGRLAGLQPSRRGAPDRRRQDAVGKRQRQGFVEELRDVADVVVRGEGSLWPMGPRRLRGLGSATVDDTGSQLARGATNGCAGRFRPDSASGGRSRPMLQSPPMHARAGPVTMRATKASTATATERRGSCSRAGQHCGPRSKRGRISATAMCPPRRRSPWTMWIGSPASLQESEVPCDG